MRFIIIPYRLRWVCLGEVEMSCLPVVCLSVDGRLGVVDGGR